SPALANDALLRGQASMVLTIPAEFEKSLVHTGIASVQLELDAEKGSSVGIVQAYASQITRDYAAELSAQMWNSPLVRQEHIETRVRGWYNASLNYKHYMVPGILVALITMISTLLTAQNIAREKEIGTLEQLNVTPLTRTEFIAAKLL